MLRYESYNKDRLAIYGDKKYTSHLKAIVPLEFKWMNQNGILDVIVKVI